MDGLCALVAGIRCLDFNLFGNVISCFAPIGLHEIWRRPILMKPDGRTRSFKINSKLNFPELNDTPKLNVKRTRNDSSPNYRKDRRPEIEETWISQAHLNKLGAIDHIYLRMASRSQVKSERSKCSSNLELFCWFGLVVATLRRNPIQTPTRTRRITMLLKMLSLR